MNKVGNGKAHFDAYVRSAKETALSELASEAKKIKRGIGPKTDKVSKAFDALMAAIGDDPRALEYVERKLAFHKKNKLVSGE